jgi:hypothetical protein
MTTGPRGGCSEKWMGTRAAKRSGSRRFSKARETNLAQAATGVNPVGDGPCVEGLVMVGTVLVVRYGVDEVVDEEQTEQLMEASKK